ETPEFFERSAAQRPRAGRIFHYERYAGRNPFECLFQQTASLNKTLIPIALAVRSKMRVDEANAARFGGLQVVTQQRQRSRGDLLVYAREINEVRRVNRARVDSGLGAHRAKRFER